MKQVLLLGDSIRLGYCANVKEALADTAEVIYPGDNCRCTHYVLESLEGWKQLCRGEDVAVVHFNCGHWDAAHFGGDETALTTLENYGVNLRKIIARLRRYFPDAVLLFATTTPMNPENNTDNRTTEELIEYNKVGIAVAEECGVPVDDLFAVAENWDASLFADSCHFTAEGYKILGETVAELIKENLN